MQIATSNRLNSVEEYYFSTKLRDIAQRNANGADIINLGIGSPDLPPHAKVIETLSEKATAHNTHGYQSYQGSPILRKAIAQFYSAHFNATINPDTEILPLIGSKEGIMHLCMTYLEAGDIVLVPNPGYPTYRAAAQLTGATILEYVLDTTQNWDINFVQLEKNDLSRAKLMFVNYPNMPTGTPATEVLFQKLLAFAQKHNILIVNDNPYSFILNDKPLSICSSPEWRKNAVELNSLSKSHNMAGWRIGWLVGDAKIITDVIRFKSNMDSGMFLPLQLAAAEALALPKTWYDSVNNVYLQRQKLVFKLLDRLNCKYNPAQQGMFVWAEIPDNFETGFDLSNAVLDTARVFITPGGIFGSAGEKFVRVSLCCTEEMIEKAITRLDDFDRYFEMMKSNENLAVNKNMRGLN